MPENLFINKYTRFLRESFAHGRAVGAIAPSSTALAAKMLAPINFTQARSLVELGPGTGVFTRALLAQMHPNAVLLALETNANFRHELAKIADPRLHIRATSATDLAHVLEGKHVDAIISGIPLALLVKPEKQALLAAVHHTLANTGVFVQFQYSLESYRILKTLFSTVSLSFTPWNIPPAVIYTCRK